MPADRHFESLNSSVFVDTTVRSANNLDTHVSTLIALKNPGVLRLWSDPDGTAVSKPFRLPPPAKALFYNLINAQGVGIGLITRDGVIGH
jgi:hypothetical protein